MEKTYQIFSYFKLNFHNEGGHCQKTNFEVFFKTQPKKIACKISTLAATPFMFFGIRWSIFDKYLLEIFFLKSVYGFAPAKSEIIKFGSGPLLLRISEIPNCSLWLHSAMDDHG